MCALGFHASVGQTSTFMHHSAFVRTRHAFSLHALFNFHMSVGQHQHSVFMSHSTFVHIQPTRTLDFHVPVDQHRHLSFIRHSAFMHHSTFMHKSTNIGTRLSCTNWFTLTLSFHVSFGLHVPIDQHRHSAFVRIRPSCTQSHALIFCTVLLATHSGQLHT